MKARIIGPEIILGITNMGEKITLFKTIESNYQTLVGEKDLSGANSLGNSTFICNIVFIGKHFSKREEILFQSMSINFTYLEQWLSPKGMFDTDFKEDRLVVSANYMKHRTIRIEPLNSELSIGSAISTERDQPASFKLSHISYFHLVPDTLKNFDWYGDIISNLECLLTLLMGVAVYPKQLIGYDTEPNTLGFRKDIKIYYIIYSAITYSNLQYWQLRSNYEKLQKYQKEDHLSNIINNWFKKRELLGPVYELFSTNYYNRSAYLHVRFLAWVQAIEAFHRRVYIGKYLPDTEYEPICSQLKSAIPDYIEQDFKNSLESRLKFGNELSLRTRLKLICNSKSASWFKYSYGKDLNKTINKIVNTRNYLTHYAGSKKDILALRCFMWVN
jgi:hypothetical protein